MSPTEVAFLVVGLVFGVVAGSILVTVARGRPGPRRNVRITIAPNAVPVRRSSTLGAVPVREPVAPVPGSPEEGALTDDEPASREDPVLAAHGSAGPAVIGTGVPSGPQGGTPPVLAGIRADAVAIPIVAGGAPDPSWALPPAEPDGNDIAGLRRLVADRRIVAETAQAAALQAVDALVAHREALAALRSRVEHARAVADPRRIAEVKERLHAAFQARAAVAAGAAEAETEAREWLDEIGRLTSAVNETAMHVAAGEAELSAMTVRLERLAREADLTRSTADRARAAYADALADLANAEARLAVPAMLSDRERGA